LAKEFSIFLESNVRNIFLPVNTRRKMNLNIAPQKKFDRFKIINFVF